jgi:hypothetical protein
MHEQAARMRRRRSEQHVDVVAHQAVCVHRAAELLCRFPHQAQVDKVVVSIGKARHAVIPAVNDMHGQVRDHQARLSGHFEQTAVAPPRD